MAKTIAKKRMKVQWDGKQFQIKIPTKIANLLKITKGDSIDIELSNENRLKFKLIKFIKQIETKKK